MKVLKYIVAIILAILASPAIILVSVFLGMICAVLFIADRLEDLDGD